jgi:dTDP-glucose 4,6-dehydratase
LAETLGTFLKKTVMRKLLVTGGAGFIGSNFVRMVLSEHHDCFIVNFITKDRTKYVNYHENR